MTRAARWIWSGLGLGFSPVAPGTCGSLLGLAIAWLLRPWMWGGPGAAALAGALCLPLGALAERTLARKDPPEFVLDEVAGALLALSLLPCGPVPWGTAFVAFRLLDAWKPGPIRGLQSRPGGWGILVDDLVAGALANGAGWLALLLSGSA